MAVGLSELLASMQQGVQAINNLITQIKTTFPQATTSSTTAPSVVGTITYTSSQATGFLLVALSSGVTVKFPYYSQ
jgi:predicted DNA-binding transcriptional regulator YafY